MKSPSRKTALCIFFVAALILASGCKGGEETTPQPPAPPATGNGTPVSPGAPSVPAAPGAPAAPSAPTSQYGSPAELTVEIYTDSALYKIDKPYYVTVVLRNNTARPISCAETFDFLAGISIRKPAPKPSVTPEGSAPTGEKIPNPAVRRVQKREKPLLIAPGTFVGKRIDLSAFFPSLRRPGIYEISWDDPAVGKSKAVSIEIVDYVLLVTNYGNISMRLRPDLAPKTVEEFKRRVQRKYYDGGFVGEISPGGWVVFHPSIGAPPLENLPAEFPKPPAPSAESEEILPGEENAPPQTDVSPEQPLAAGYVAVVREVDSESLVGGKSERDAFLNSGSPSFFIQVRAVKGGEQYTVFAKVIDGMDVVYAISGAELLRDAQGISMRMPAASIRILRAVVVDSAPETGAAAPVEFEKGRKPSIIFRLFPPLQAYPYGSQMEAELILINDSDSPLAVPPSLALTSGLRVERITSAMRSEAGPEGATTEREIEEKQPLEPSPTAPQYPLPLASARMEPGDIVGVAVDITPLYREFASGGRFEIRWEIGDLKTETLPLNIIKTVYAVIDTNKGPIRVVLFEDEAPKNVARFVELARKGFYDGKPFHHAVDTQDLALVQTGSPTGTGTGRAEGELLPLEPTGRRLKAGAVVMARTSDPNSASAQFFIIKRISESLADEYKGRYTVIGQVVSETAPQMGPQPTGGGAPPAPAQPDSIQILMSLAKGDTVNKITIYEKPPLK